MNEILQYVILDNTVMAWLICAGVIVLVFGLRKFFSRLVSQLLFKIIKQRSWKIDQKAFVQLLLQPMQFFLIITITLLALDKLTFPRALDFDVYHVSVRHILDSVAKAIFIIVFIRLLRRIIDFIALLLEQRANLAADTNENQMIVFFKDFFKALLLVIGILLVIRFSFNKDITTYLAGLSIVAGALALAARESLENLIASFIIFFDKPFQVGDLVKVQTITGTVERIGLRSTRVRTDQKTYVTVPNKQMLDSIMDNLTLRSMRRADLKLELSLQTAPDDLDKAVAGVKAILSEQVISSYTAFLSDITPTAFVLHIEYYTATIPVADFNKLRQKVNLAILRMLDDMNIDLAGENKEVLVRPPAAPAAAENAPMPTNSASAPVEKL